MLARFSHGYCGAQADVEILLALKAACVLPSRPRPTSRSTGRIHISDFRQQHLTCKGQPVHTLGATPAGGNDGAGRQLMRR
jgi:hypothetical protein